MTRCRHALQRRGGTGGTEDGAGCCEPSSIGSRSHHDARLPRRRLRLRSDAGRVGALRARLRSRPQAPRRSTAARRRGHDDVHVARVEALPFPDATFDVVTCLDVIEHTPDDRASLAELRRVTRPGGLMLVTVPAYQALWSQHDEVNLHFRRYDRSSLRAASLDAGWDVVGDTHFNGILLAPAAAVRLAAAAGARASTTRTIDLTPRALNTILEAAAAARVTGPRRRQPAPAGASLLAFMRSRSGQVTAAVAAMTPIVLERHAFGPRTVRPRPPNTRVPRQAWVLAGGDGAVASRGNAADLLIAALGLVAAWLVVKDWRDLHPATRDPRRGHSAGCTASRLPPRTIGDALERRRAAALVRRHGSDTLSAFKLRRDLGRRFSPDGRAMAGVPRRGRSPARRRRPGRATRRTARAARRSRRLRAQARACARASSERAASSPSVRARSACDACTSATRPSSPPAPWTSPAAPRRASARPSTASNATDSPPRPARRRRARRPRWSPSSTRSARAGATGPPSAGSR